MHCYAVARIFLLVPMQCNNTSTAVVIRMLALANNTNSFVNVLRLFQLGPDFPTRTKLHDHIDVARIFEGSMQPKQHQKRQTGISYVNGLSKIRYDYRFGR